MLVLIASLGFGDLPELPLTTGLSAGGWPEGHEFNMSLLFDEDIRTLSASRLSVLFNKALDRFYGEFRKRLQEHLVAQPEADVLVLWFRVPPTLIATDAKNFALFTHYYVRSAREADIHPDVLTVHRRLPEFRWNHEYAFPAGTTTHATL